MSTALEKRWFGAIAQITHCVLDGRFGIQVSHSNQHRGLSQKSAPWMCAAVCSHCHHEIDNGPNLSQLERRELHARAVVLTHAKLIEMGLLQLNTGKRLP